MVLFVLLLVCFVLCVGFVKLGWGADLFVVCVTIVLVFSCCVFCFIIWCLGLNLFLIMMDCCFWFECDVFRIVGFG